MARREPDESIEKQRWPVLVAVERIQLRERLYDLLTRHGFPVITAPSIRRTLDTLKHERPSAILTEAPGSDRLCWSLISGIRSFDAQVPIVLFSPADTLPSDVDAARGVQAVLATDAPDEAILMALYRWLRSPLPAPKGLGTGTVMVVDDEPKLRNLLSGFLTMRDYAVVTANSGEEALARLQQANPQLIMLDIKLPGMDGLLTLRKLKAVRPDVTVIMTTGIDEEATMAQAFMSGAYEYVTKPYNLKYLDSVLVHLTRTRTA